VQAHIPARTPAGSLSDPRGSPPTGLVGPTCRFVLSGLLVGSACWLQLSGSIDKMPAASPRTGLIAHENTLLQALSRKISRSPLRTAGFSNFSTTKLSSWTCEQKRTSQHQNYQQYLYCDTLARLDDLLHPA